ncbi:MAG: cyclic pyranopterin monophosphate synthase MoaC [Bacillota bacterium]|nr:cyclic pyranopterin monophosphate synthase MoaC [Bacillota bacterium]
MSQLNHFNEAGEAHMVCVAEKEITARRALAAGCIRMLPETLALIESGTAKKGDVLGVARIAGIMAVKRTPELIPLAHPIGVEGCTVDFRILPELPGVEASCCITVNGRTGAEMEALTGVSAALLTIYDMVKAVDRAMEISNIRLLEKSGGKSGEFKRAE